MSASRIAHSGSSSESATACASTASFRTRRRTCVRPMRSYCRRAGKGFPLSHSSPWRSNGRSWRRTSEAPRPPSSTATQAGSFHPRIRLRSPRQSSNASTIPTKRRSERSQGVGASKSGSPPARCSTRSRACCRNWHRPGTACRRRSRGSTTARCGVTSARGSRPGAPDRRATTGAACGSSATTASPTTTTSLRSPRARSALRWSCWSRRARRSFRCTKPSTCSSGP